MPRRASSGANPVIIILFVVAIAVIGYMAMSFVKGGKDERFSDTTPLQVGDFLANGNSLRGNTYRFEGTVDEKLRYTPSKGQILSVYIDQANGSGYIPVEVPASADLGNIETRQKYMFKATFREGGIAVASAIEAL